MSNIHMSNYHSEEKEDKGNDKEKTAALQQLIQSKHSSWNERDKFFKIIKEMKHQLPQVSPTAQIACVTANVHDKSIFFTVYDLNTRTGALLLQTYAVEWASHVSDNRAKREISIKTGWEALLVSSGMWYPTSGPDDDDTMHRAMVAWDVITANMNVVTDIRHDPEHKGHCTSTATAPLREYWGEFPIIRRGKQSDSRSGGHAENTVAYRCPVCRRRGTTMRFEWRHNSHQNKLAAGRRRPDEEE